jgi:rhamnosyltransferase
MEKSGDKSFRIVVPVKNGGARWVEAAQALAGSVSDPTNVVVIDSESTDGSAAVAARHGFIVHQIPVRTFNHGRTRQDAVHRFAVDRQFVIFLTQDAVVADRNSIAVLLQSFEDPRVAGAFGRQLPHTAAQPFEAHAAFFNYAANSETRTAADTSRLGIKTAYFSNSFAAYRILALQHSGGFPDHLILGEDVYVAMRMLLAGMAIRYCAEATVRHSHDYTVRQEMQRYFDFGVMHRQIPELLNTFGAPEGEGLAFVLSELRFILREAPLRLLQWPIRNGAKYVGYRLGRGYRALPKGLAKRLSMTKVYWDNSTAKPQPELRTRPSGNT